MSPSYARICCCLFASFLALPAAAQNSEEKPNGDLQAKVEKIFVTHCFDCHAGDEAESGFRLDASRGALLAGGDSGDVAIVPGELDQGSLLQWISSADEAERMPPDSGPLARNDLETIRQWILEGAKVTQPFRKEVTQLWSFQPIQRQFDFSAHPTSVGKINNPIDVFVSKRLKEIGLELNPKEERKVLIRRLFLVTLGVPPSPSQVDAFVHDQDPDAYSKLVDQVLSSQEYGEKWAQHWLDIIRFGETHGFETNRERPNAWHFRDYVIESLNEDKPYDQFIQEQIAGDELDVPVATGFIVAGPHDIVKSPDINLTLMQRQDELADIVNVTGTTFLGLTVGCARCHNHKFDPISQKDFYSMQAIFAGVQHADRALAPTRNVAAEIEVLTSKAQDLEAKLQQFVRPIGQALIAIDDQELEQKDKKFGVRHLVTKSGTGKNPGGTKRGHRQDPGSLTRSPNISRGEYSWWKNVPDQPVAEYTPLLSGKYRIWLSWGSGHATHTTDAVYEMDRDGDLKTDADRELIATVNQQNFADGSGAPVGLALWSGFKDAGVHQLNEKASIVLRGGKTGTAITADILIFEKVSGAKEEKNAPTSPAVRPSVNATHNIDAFEPVEARYVRFAIMASSQSQPCIDELEIFSGDKNVALASAGAKATSGGDFVHPLHKLAHINDGKFGNSNSWIAQDQTGWVQIEFSQPFNINRVEWARDRNGQFADRLPIQYRIEVATVPGQWTQVSSSSDRLPFQKNTKPQVQYEFARFPESKASQGKNWLSELKNTNRLLAELSKPKLVYAGNFAAPGPTYRLYRGDPLQKREQVEPNTISSLGNLELSTSEKESSRRLRFARWLTSEDNSLVSRVMVNRLWQHSFGQGIVGTPNDFGNSGRKPSHPKLLDWLASELVESDWSLKHVHRLILNSHAFQQSSRAYPKGMRVDASGELYWRYVPRRLEAESIRDAILTVSGVLNHRVGGPGFDGFEVEMENVRHFFPKKNFGPADWRRMIYMTKVRQERDAVFGAFDCPDASQVISKRSRSTTPLQSLNLLNSTFVLQQSGMMARRLERLSAAQQRSPVTIAYELAYSRSATEQEVSEGEEFVAEFGLSAFCRALLNSNEFIFIQ